MPGAQRDDRGPVGVVLAGGLGRRIGGDKAVVSLAGQPLVAYGLAALRGGLGSEPVVVAKRDTVLPALPRSVAVWIEPDRPRHPLTGIVHALQQARGRDVFVLAVDLPLVTAALVREVVAAAADQPGTTILAGAGGVVQPLCGLHAAATLPALQAAAQDARLTDVLAAVGATVLVLHDPGALLNVNTRADATRGERFLDDRARRR